MGGMHRMHWKHIPDPVFLPNLLDGTNIVAEPIPEQYEYQPRYKPYSDG